MRYNERQTRIIASHQTLAEAAYFVAMRLLDRSPTAAIAFQKIAADYSWTVRRIMGVDDDADQT